MAPNEHDAQRNASLAQGPWVTPSRLAVVLISVIAALVAFAAGMGLFWSSGTGQATVMLVRGEVVPLYGSGLYRFESATVGPIHRGTDAVALVLWLPLLVGGVVHYRRGSIRGTLAVLAALLWLAYLYLSLAVGAAYNELFVVYVALVGLCGSAMVLVVRSIAIESLASDVSPRFPRRGVAHLLLVTALGTTVAWGSLAVEALITGTTPAHMHATTTVEEALSLGLLVPACVFAAVALYRKDLGVGIVLGVPLLALIAGLAPVVLAQTVAQALAGVVLAVEDIVRLVAIWLVLGGIALGLLGRVWRTVTTR